MTGFFSKSFSVSALAIASLSLASCGGGGGGSSTPVTPPGGGGGGSTGPTWTQGVFQNEDQFKNRCAAPRSGIDPATNSAYLDVAGSTLLENHWLRSWSNNTYLWYNEITDQNPASFNDRLAYFDELKTNALTASGNPVDRFHFTIPTDEYQQRVSSGASAGYGFDLALLSTSPPRDIRIAYTDPNTPAASNNISRGAIILEVDGVDAVNGGTQADVDTLNAALFPSGSGEQHTFVIQELGAAQTRTVTLTSGILTIDPVNRTEIINTPSGDVGYILFNTFGTTTAEKSIVDAMTVMETAGVSDLVLDLRYNGGGFLDISAELGYMVAGTAQTSGKIYDKITFNDKHPTINPVTGNAVTSSPFYPTARGFSVPSGQALPRLNLDKVYILSTSGTCSASEALINGLRGIDVDVVLIGTNTCGKPYGFYATDNCGETYFTIQFRGQNDKGFGDYADGFTPQNTASPQGEVINGCAVPDDFGNQLGDNSEALLAAALQHRINGACPSTSVSTKPAVNFSAYSDGQFAPGDLMADPRVRARQRLETIRIDNAPTDPK